MDPRGTNNGQFNFPIGLVTSSTHLFVADTDSHRIQVFEACQDNQIHDRIGVCHTPEPFEFSGLKSTYRVDEPLTGTLSFENNIPATSYTVTDGALLDGITFNNNGTWG